MKFVATRTLLLAAVQRAASALGKDKSKPILDCIVIRTFSAGITLLGSSTARSVETTCEATISDPGEVAIPAATMISTLKAAGGDAVTLELLGNGKVAIKAAGGSYKINALDAADYLPIAPLDGATATFSAVGTALAECIRRMADCVAPPGNRYGLDGARVEPGGGDTLRLVATDGNRLAWAECPIRGTVPNNARQLIPGDTLPLIAAMCGAGEITVTLAARSGEVRSGDTVLRFRLLEADFPDYRQVLPTTWKRRVHVDAGELGDAVRRVMPMAQDASHTVRVEVGAEGIALSTRALDTGEATAEVSVDVEGDPIRIAWSGTFLLDALAAIGNRRIVLSIGTEMSPIVITSEGVAGLWVVMPVRLD